MKLRFSIRDLLWLGAVAALAVGWWLDHRRPTETKSPDLQGTDENSHGMPRYVDKAQAETWYNAGAGREPKPTRDCHRIEDQGALFQRPCIRWLDGRLGYSAAIPGERSCFSEKFGRWPNYN